MLDKQNQGNIMNLTNASLYEIIKANDVYSIKDIDTKIFRRLGFSKFPTFTDKEFRNMKDEVHEYFGLTPMYVNELQFFINGSKEVKYKALQHVVKLEMDSTNSTKMLEYNMGNLMLTSAGVVAYLNFPNIRFQNKTLVKYMINNCRRLEEDTKYTNDDVERIKGKIAGLGYTVSKLATHYFLNHHNLFKKVESFMTDINNDDINVKMNLYQSIVTRLNYIAHTPYHIHKNYNLFDYFDVIIGNPNNRKFGLSNRVNKKIKSGFKMKAVKSLIDNVKIIKHREIFDKIIIEFNPSHVYIDVTETFINKEDVPKVLLLMAKIIKMSDSIINFKMLYIYMSCVETPIFKSKELFNFYKGKFLEDYMILETLVYAGNVGLILDMEELNNVHDMITDDLHKEFDELLKPFYREPKLVKNSNIK